MTEKANNSSYWESILAEVSSPPDSREVLFDPYVIETILTEYTQRYTEFLKNSTAMESERWAQIEKLKQIATRKLPGKQKECLLMLLVTGYSYRQIAKILGLSKDAVRRNIIRGAAKMKEHIIPAWQKSFPKRKNHHYHTVILPMDTAEEKVAFQNFINEHQVIHISYSGDSGFREALIIYQIADK